MLDRSLVDEWIKSHDRDSFLMARRLIQQEGLLVGGSSGSAVWAAVEIAKKYGPNKRIVTLVCDQVRNYMTKFMDDRWMRENGFVESSWETVSLGDFLRSLPPRELITARAADTIGRVIEVMRREGISQVPVVDQGKLVGILTETDLLHALIEGKASREQAVAEVMYRNVKTVPASADAGILTSLFTNHYAALVLDDDDGLLGIVTKMDLVDFLTRSAAGMQASATS